MSAHAEPSVHLSPMTMSDSITPNDRTWQHYLSNISSSVSNKLTVIAALYSLIGILSIGLDVGLMSYGYYGYLIGIANGLFLLIVGTLTLILCRQQVYVLTSLFVVVFFQLMLSLTVFLAYAYIFYEFYKSKITCYEPLEYCSWTPFYTVLIVHMLHVFLTFCLAVTNLIIIKNARRLPIPSQAPRYVMFAPSPPVSFQNPRATSVNQNDSV